MENEAHGLFTKLLEHICQFSKVESFTYYWTIKITDQFMTLYDRVGVLPCNIHMHRKHMKFKCHSLVLNWLLLFNRHGLLEIPFEVPPVSINVSNHPAHSVYTCHASESAVITHELSARDKSADELTNFNEPLSNSDGLTLK